MRRVRGKQRRLSWLTVLLLVPGFVLALAFAAPARAAGAGDVFAGLTSPDFNAIQNAVTELAASGNPRAGAVIAALADNRLYTWRWPRPDHGLFIKEPSGNFVDARTGKPIATPPFPVIRPVIVNDMVRSAIDAAKGMLDLFSRNVAVRKQAAEALFEAADPDSLPLIIRALAHEQNPDVHGLLVEAEAAARLKSAATPISEKLAAIRVIGARDDLAARSLLASLSNAQGPVAAAAAAAVKHIDYVLSLWNILETAYYGVSLGSVLLLAAAGLAITFGVMGVINMAHGEIVMVGAYTTLVVQQLVAAFFPALSDWSLLLSIPAAFIVAGILGIIIEQTLIRFLYGRPLETLLATWGLSLILMQAVRSIFGPTNVDVTSPSWMSGAVQLGGLTLTLNRLWIIAFTAGVVVLLMLAFRVTRLGLAMRAVTQNRRMAAAMGIRTPIVDALTFGLGCGIAGIAGVALSQIDNVSPNLGQNYIIDSFMVVVFGGVGNLWGAVVAALILGIVNMVLEPISGAVLGKIAVLVLLILFIQRRPRGLFPVKGRAVEA
ncbi:MAG TPA: urea ABC transporter permease subunit UrtB [Acetobacteraceae bacterium]|nr:urea ABC transporter permease subunit UrtB [Acetobacteraceae bacterium]